MIGAEAEAAKRDEYLNRLMAPPNATWSQTLASVRESSPPPPLPLPCRGGHTNLPALPCGPCGCESAAPFAGAERVDSGICGD